MVVRQSARAVIGEMPAGTKRTMLERLYLEYQDLCAYAHGRPVAGFGKSIFDERSPLRTQFMQLWGEENLHDAFRQRILGAAQIYSLLSVAQATAELTTLSPERPTFPTNRVIKEGPGAQHSETTVEKK